MAWVKAAESNVKIHLWEWSYRCFVNRIAFNPAKHFHVPIITKYIDESFDPLIRNPNL